MKGRFASLLLLVAACQTPSDPPPTVVAELELPLTVPETTDGTETSTFEEVLEFLDALEDLPHADRIARRIIGSTNEGRALPLIAVADPMPAAFDDLARTDKLRLLVNANIHGGEVEGKEAVQMLLREFAAGEHADLLAQAVVFFVPVYNADGNDRIDPANRASQNGPERGVGERANAQGLDLNRDFIKVESPECEALMSVFRTFDPHLFMDLHTTNGSYHGYHLTYSPSLSTNVDPELDDFEREMWIPQIRAAMQSKHDFRVFDYGNFTRGEDRRWVTYDHRPRFGTNYYSLRNRLSLLSEAYSYSDFTTRIAATRAFVLETLRASCAHSERIKAICVRADERVTRESVPFGWNTSLAPPRMGEILVGSVEEVELAEGLGTRRMALPGFEAERMGIQDGFVSQETRGLPLGWAVPAPTDELVRVLDAHGISYERLLEPRSLPVSRFVPTEVKRAERPFQGHHNVQLKGAWAREQEEELPAGSLLISARTRLGRVAAQLLEPLSEDSLATWNVFDEGTTATTTEAEGAYPVLRLHE